MKNYWFVEDEGRIEVGDADGEAAGFVPVTGEVSTLVIATWVATGVGLGLGVGQGFSRELHSCQEAVSMPPNSFQREWQRSDQCL